MWTHVGRHGREQRVVQIAAVHAQIRRVVEALRHRQFARDLAGVADPVEMRIGRERKLAQPLLDADAAQHLHRVRHHLDAGADARKARSLLVDLHVDADLAQRGGGRKATHAGADDCNGQLTIGHWFLPRLLLFDAGADDDVVPFLDVGLEQSHQLLGTARPRLDAEIEETLLDVR